MNKSNWKEALNPCCLICSYYEEDYCTNAESKEMIEGGLPQKITNPNKWYSPLFDLKAVG